MTTLDERDRRLHLRALAIIAVAAVVHHCILFLWYVDDAAITFAYSKNLASGEGLVPFVGGERVEGYSNPTWTFFLVPFAFVGIDLVTFVRWLQPVLVLLTVGVTYLAGREAFATLEEDGPTETARTLARHAPLFAPAVLAVSAQFATWTGSGLEIALMNLLLALAIWRTLVELRTGWWPASALLWLAVALCRPEAILYAAAAGFTTMVYQLRSGRGLLPTVQWLVLFFVPFGLYHAWRYSYFAWEFPNTYYAKMERRPGFPMWRWAARTWRYTRDFAYNMGWGFFVPIWTLGAIGHRGWRWSVALAIGVTGALVIGLGTPKQEVLVPAVAFALLVAAWSVFDRRQARPVAFVVAAAVFVALAAPWVGLHVAEVAPEPIAIPGLFRTAPPFLLVSLAVVTFGLSFSERRVPARPLVLSLCLAAVTFAVIAQWDWMQGYRWYAPAVVPGALLFAFGLHHLGSEVAERVTRGRPSRVAVAVGVAAAAVLLAVPPNVYETWDRVEDPDASPKGVRRRANYVKKVRDRLHLEERLRDFEVDMGGHMYWTDFEMVDIAGLVDVPMGHHKFQPAFIDEYLFEEQRPHFVHLHDAWERNSKIKRRPAWRRGVYLEIPPYPAGGTRLHGGNHVRRDLVLPKAWPHGGEPTSLEKGVTVHGVDVPSEPPTGGEVYLEIGVSQRDVAGQDDFVTWLTASDGTHVQRWDVAPAYGWIGASEWRDDEVAVGRYSLDVPATLPPGDYALTLTVVGEKGEVRHVEETGASEVVVGTLTVLTDAAALEAAEADRAAALAAATAVRCEEAERSWFLARKHQVADREWREGHEDELERALAECWAKHAEGRPREEQIAALIRAREHDHWSPTYLRAAGALADELHAEGLVAREAQDWEAAYRAFSDAVAVDRSRSWSRRYAEEARAERLGLGESRRRAKTARR